MELAKQSLEFRRKKQEDDQKEREAKREERARSEESKKAAASEKRKEKEEEKSNRAEEKRRNAVRKSEEAKTERLRSKVKQKSTAVKDRMSKAKSAMPSDLEQISDKEGDASAVGKLGSNVAKTAVGVTGAAYQLSRAAYEKMRERKYKKELGKRSPEEGTTKQRLKYKLRGAALAGARKIGYDKEPENNNSKSPSAISKLKRGIRKSALIGARRIGYTEEFLYEVDKPVKKEKIEKIIDIMKGKNKIEINPNIKEASFEIDPEKLKAQRRQEKIRGMMKSSNPNEVQVAKKKLQPSAAVDLPKIKKEETVMVQDANGNDYVEIIDLIKPEPLKKNISEIHKQGHAPHEVPSKNLKRLVAKASKRVDTDADADIDVYDKVKGESGEYASNIKSKKIYNVTSAREVPKKSLSSYEIPSGNLKGLVTKAVKRIDTDADGDTDHNDKAKGELGEFIPGVNNKRLFSTTRTKTAKESFSNWRTEIEEDWQKVNKSDKTDGMSPAAVKAYRRENPGSKLKTAVTGNPKPGSTDAKRRKSFCSRSKGQQDMHNIDCSKTPDKAICKARRRWKC